MAEFERFFVDRSEEFGTEGRDRFLVVDFNRFAFTEEIEKALRKYEEAVREHLRFGEVHLVQPTLDKGYTGKTAVPVYECDRHIGDLTILLMVAEDGTGAQGAGIGNRAYSLGMLSIPEVYKFYMHPEKVIPRVKGHQAELVLPLFTANANDVYPFACSLESLTVDWREGEGMATKKPWIARERTFGPETSEFIGSLASGDLPKKPHAYFTVGYTPDRKRFGDPHAIHASRNLPGNLVQVVGFLPLDLNTGEYNICRSALI